MLWCDAAERIGGSCGHQTSGVIAVLDSESRRFVPLHDRPHRLHVDTVSADQLLLERPLAVTHHELPLLFVRQADLALSSRCVAVRS